MLSHLLQRGRLQRSRRQPSRLQPLRSLSVTLLALGLLAIAWTAIAGPETLQGPDAFESIADPAERSAALFVEAGKVLLHPRCLNCHPAGDVPLQGENGEMHQPKVLRGADGNGVPGLQCATCHMTENFDPGGVPGAPNWHLAPESMAWEGRTLKQLCEQLKDPVKAHMDLEGLIRHMSEDPLVAWAWQPGEGREAPPGSQAQLGELIAAWVATGAECPSD